MGLQTDTIFYDGTCGLCHRGVQFIVKHDPRGTAFRFSPLQGETFRLSQFGRADVPGNSMIVHTHDGRLLHHSAAWVHILNRLEGRWRIAAGALRLVPPGIRDAVYGFVARNRYRLSSRPTDTCAVLSTAERARFDR